MGNIYVLMFLVLGKDTWTQVNVDSAHALPTRIAMKQRQRIESQEACMRSFHFAMSTPLNSNHKQ